MNSGDSAGLGSPLKKPAAKPEAKKPLGGLGGGGKSIGGDAPAPPAPSAPPVPASFEFEDEPAPKLDTKKPATVPAAFNPFDQPVSVPAANAAAASAPTTSGTNRIEKPGTGRTDKPATARVEKPGTGRSEKPGTGRSEKPGTGSASRPGVTDPADGDIAPGLAKDLWLCPHCGAKNKPSRETCRECKKSPQDEVEKPWFLQPRIIGPVAGGLVLVVVLIMWLSSVDLALHPVGTVDKAVRAAGTTQSVEDLGDTRKFFIKKTAAVSGRVIAVSDYAVAPWLQAVVVGLGSSASDDAAFGTWTAQFDGDTITVNAARYATLFLIHNGSKPALKPGSYISLLGKSGVPEQDNTIVKGTDNPNCWTIKVERIETQ
jgi:hypothetical protein